MSPDKSPQNLFNEALERPDATERARFLDEACGAEVALRERLEKLLRAHDEAGGFFSQPSKAPASQATRTIGLPVTEKPGDRIGHYKLLQQIGEGGCGVVYMAEQEEPVRRRVALKVIKLGMDTKQVIARFEAERQALALMDHPNIAKIFDAGITEVATPGSDGRARHSVRAVGQTSESGAQGTDAPYLSAGRPYFVMELVRGIKITEFCDENKLSTEDRLKLFMLVCQAIQHAHQKGIIHRDIKPSNILVTINDGVPVPKVIDFGIAKATVGRLTDQTLFTAFEQFIGTPAYMSPEQAVLTSLDIDTRSDIYSLGVLLYELLTGRTPFDQKELLAAGLDEMRRTIREVEPVKPSTRLTQEFVAAHVSPLKSHPESARNVRADSRRLLQEVKGDLDWIVMKCLEKDRARRYETANGLAMDIERHLNCEPVVARPPSRLYEFQKTVRRHKFGFAAAVVLIMVVGLGVLASTWQAIRAMRAEREQIKLREEADLGKRAAQTEAAKSQQVAQFMQDVLQGVGPSAALGRDTTMLREILDKTAERVAGDLKDQPDVEAELRNSIGTVYWELGDGEKSWAMHSQALTIRRKLFGNEHPSVATSLHNLAEALRHRGKLAEAEAAYREALRIRRKLFGNDHPAVADSLNYLGSLLSIELKDGEPETLLREALAIRRKLHGNKHGVVGVSLDNLAHVLNRQGQVVEATAMHYEALAIRKKFFGDQHPELVYSYRNLAGALQGQGKLVEAEVMLRNALSLCDKLLGQRHPDMPAIHSELGGLLRAQGKLKEAGAFENKLDASAQTAATSLHEAGRYFQQQGKLAEAELVCREALGIRRKSLGNEHRLTGYSARVLGGILQIQGNHAEAVVLFQEELDRARAAEGKGLASTNFSFGWVLHHLAEALWNQKAFKEARPPAEEAWALYEKYPDWPEGERSHAYHVLNAVLADLNDQPALESLQRAMRVHRMRWSLTLKTADSSDANALNEAAWLLATCEDAAFRDGPRAVQLAEKAALVKNRKDAAILDTLAAAYAETGEFAKAVSVQKEAITLLSDENQKKDFASRLKLYEANTPYREGRPTANSQDP